MAQTVSKIHDTIKKHEKRVDPPTVDFSHALVLILPDMEIESSVVANSLNRRDLGPYKTIMAPHRALDLSLYLVTDSTAAILGERDLVQIVQDALEGGVTIVQYRDKHADTEHMVEMARKIHHVTKKFNVPFLINDRLDVALVTGVEGIHIGQDDISITAARKLLPPNAIIGVTASSVEEAKQAIEGGADYLGIGTMFGTPTKKDAKSIIGTQGMRNILKSCQVGTAWPVPCVAIGGINVDNVQRVLYQTRAETVDGTNGLNGVAVVSAIIAADNAMVAARDLQHRVKSVDSVFYLTVRGKGGSATDGIALVKHIPPIVRSHASASVLCHNMTNTVVQNFAANVCLAVGSSPIMSMNGEEAADLAKLRGALVVNMGTVTPDILKVYLAGLQAYNASGNPVLFDPVGGGATTVRKEAIKLLLRGGYFTVIKGNEGEISAVMGSTSVQQRGVDSGPSSLTKQQKIEMVRKLSLRERCVVLMTGAVDFLSDGHRTVAISNGTKWLGTITGSGCALGSVVASYVAHHRDDKFLAALAGILHYEVAAEMASTSPSCKGPGTFIPAFLDNLYHVKEMLSQSNEGWENFVGRALVEWV